MLEGWEGVGREGLLIRVREGGVINQGIKFAGGVFGVENGRPICVLLLITVETHLSVRGLFSLVSSLKAGAWRVTLYDEQLAYPSIAPLSENQPTICLPGRFY